MIEKFVSHKTVTRLYKARVNLRNIKLLSLFPGNHFPESKDRISIYANLTSYEKKIDNEANGMRRDGLRTIESMDDADGQIFPKTSRDGRLITIMGLDELKAM